MAVYKRDMVDINLETGNIHRSFLKHSIGYKDAAADHFGIRVYRDGVPVDLTGVSVQGVFMPPQGSPIAITSGNIVSGNEAEVVLPQACYNYDGQFTLSIKLVDATNAVTGTMRIVDGMVDNTHASGTVAPTSAVPTYQEVLSTYEQAIAAINKTVRFDASQSLTDTQKATARTNIAAASAADLATETANREAADADLKSAIAHQYDFSNKGNAKPGAKIGNDETIGGDNTKHRWFDVELSDVKGLSHWYMNLENKTQYYMLMYFVSRDSSGAKITATSGWRLVSNGTDLLTFMTGSFLTGASKVSVTYIFSSTTTTSGVISGIGDLAYNFWLSGKLYAESKDVTNEINDVASHKMENEYTTFEYALGSSTNDGGWFAYPDVILKANRKHYISFTTIEFSGSIAFINSSMEVEAVYSVTNNSLIDYTPEEDVFPLMFSIPYSTGTGFPTTKLYRSTSALSVGDTIALDSSWSYNTFSWGIKIERVYTLNEIVDSIPSVLSNHVVYVDVNGSGKYTSVVDAVENEPEGTVIYILPGVYDGTVQAFTKRIILIGTDRNKCIIRSTDGRYDYPAINGSCGYLENLTLYSQYVSGESHEIDSETSGAYAFHCENEYGKGKELEFHHCTLISDFCPGLGAGLRKDFHLILDDCILENRQILNRGVYTDVGSLGALYFHDSNGEQGNSYVTVKNCILRSSLGKTMTPYQVARETQNNHVYCDFVEDVLYDATNKYTNNIWYRGDPFNPSTGIFSIEIGFGNSNAALNNN